jgi:hypothetical protein
VTLVDASGLEWVSEEPELHAPEDVRSTFDAEIAEFAARSAVGFRRVVGEWEADFASGHPANMHAAPGRARVRTPSSIHTYQITAGGIGWVMRNIWPVLLVALLGCETPANPAGDGGADAGADATPFDCNAFWGVATVKALDTWGSTSVNAASCAAVCGRLGTIAETESACKSPTTASPSFGWWCQATDGYASSYGADGGTTSVDGGVVTHGRAVCVRLP